MNNNVFLSIINQKLEDSFSNMMHSLWMVLTNKDPSWIEQFESDEDSYFRLSKQFYNFLDVNQKRVLNSENKIELRQKEVLKCEAMEISNNNESQTESQKLWNSLHYRLISDKVSYKSKKISKQECLNELKSNINSSDRKELWVNYMAAGENIAPGLIQLVKIRNKIAIEKGFKNFYDLKMSSQELDINELNLIIKNIRESLDPVYTFIKGKIDERQKERFKLNNVSCLEPWHYQDPYFQNYSYNDNHLKSFEPNIFFKHLLSTFRTNGMNLEEIEKYANLSLDLNKSPESFCFNIDRNEDIRISCNTSPDIKGVKVLLHELGHAVYEKYLDNELPFILKQPASIFLSEGLALLFERLITNVPIQEKLKIKGFNCKKDHLENIIINLYWTMTVIKFEQELYQNPDQDLNKLWWELVEDIQQISRPSDKSFSNLPAWATKSHLTTLPVYYQNYMLGQILASQFEHTLKKITDNNWFSPPGIEHLKRNVFSTGKLSHWKKVVLKSTGSDISPEFLINDLVQLAEMKE
ncbi:hypothetical protein [Cytobacillus firmus]|uniref:hypothetical protein n=1 Tax=Cytobacillus firmus TaxID=1399 RepID=UPI0030011E88